MTTFDEREAAFEAKYAHDAEMRFKAEARADRKIALWAAEKLGKTADAAEAYVVEVIRADMEEAGAEDVVRKITADVGAMTTADEVRALYSAYLKEAKAELVEA
ncbi:DUF1476 domain-containing protein [Celeribacter litoreus]|uniref:DUF1476 domain-containing protein n=1 Tax=Celeribacter litoreus TaxID=2876714 RepID=UPI001CC954AE|nr:DUF1476 domain-containing protein [Celeribacter litoreus]MCA0044745.1 DUF1476 domain-containing protein [Celeribacter litoreus]